ncbi:MAG: hypothetical protein ABGX16_23990, partial [Pirellulales bacterium]
MDVSSFLSGNYLTHLDLPLPLQAWTISKADQQLVGTDQKVCVTFAEYPAKAIGLNKTNLRRIVELYGLDGTAWTGKQLQVYRSTTTYSGKVMQCVRVCGPGQAMPDPVCDAQGNVLPPVAPTQAATEAVQQPVAAPQQQQAAAGDTVWLRGGVYEFNAGLGASANAVYFNKSGAPGQR